MLVRTENPYVFALCNTSHKYRHSQTSNKKTLSKIIASTVCIQNHCGRCIFLCVFFQLTRSDNKICQMCTLLLRAGNHIVKITQWFGFHWAILQAFNTYIKEYFCLNQLSHLRVVWHFAAKIHIKEEWRPNSSHKHLVYCVFRGTSLAFKFFCQISMFESAKSSNKLNSKISINHTSRII